MVRLTNPAGLSQRGHADRGSGAGSLRAGATESPRHHWLHAVLICDGPLADPRIAVTLPPQLGVPRPQSRVAAVQPGTPRARGGKDPAGWNGARPPADRPANPGPGASAVTLPKPSQNNLPLSLQVNTFIFFH